MIALLRKQFCHIANPQVERRADASTETPHAAIAEATVAITECVRPDVRDLASTSNPEPLQDDETVEIASHGSGSPVDAPRDREAQTGKPNPYVDLSEVDDTEFDSARVKHSAEIPKAGNSMSTAEDYFANTATQYDPPLPQAVTSAQHDLDGWAQADLYDDLQTLYSMVADLKRMIPIPELQDSRASVPGLHASHARTSSKSLSRPVIVHVVNQTPQDPVPYPKPLRQPVQQPKALGDHLTPASKRRLGRSSQVFQSADSRTYSSWNNTPSHAPTPSMVDETESVVLSRRY